ncbi:MAG: glycosyltransferase [Bacteroidales bacterium]|nr:glycosyltransferase [Bacteroidales bacterium]
MEVKLSVIVPLYNSAAWLPKCLDSLLCQDLDALEYEIICVDDGSPDHSKDLAASYSVEHPNVKVVSQPNQGTAGARNTGMRYAVGKYLCFVDPDDYVEKNVYGGLVKRMEEKDLDMLRFNYRIVDEQYREMEKSEMENKFDYSSQLMTGTDFLAKRLDISCYVWAYLYRASLIKDNGIWCLQGEYIDDSPWLPQVCMKANRVDLTDQRIYYYYQRSEGLVRATSPEAMVKKTDGVHSLISTLQRQLNDVKDAGVRQWYESMIAFSVTSLLSMVALSRYQDAKVTIKSLKSMGVFPLHPIPWIPSASKKASIINLSPHLFCWLLHVKDNKQ